MVFNIYLYPFSSFFFPDAKGIPRQEMNTNSCGRVRDKNVVLLLVICRIYETARECSRQLQDGSKYGWVVFQCQMLRCLIAGDA